MSVCTHLEWVSAPQIPPCAIGEPADYRGLKFYAFYDDGAKQEVDVILKMFHELNLQAEGAERPAQITYEKKKLPVQIPLKNITLTSVQAVPRGELRCVEGSPFDRSQVVVSARYSDGSSRVIDNYKIAPHLALSASDEKITFRYGRCSFDLPISVCQVQTESPTQSPVAPQPSTQPLPAGSATSVAEGADTSAKPSSKTVVAISVAKKPNRQKYLVDDTMVDLKGGKLDVIYSDGSVGQIDMVADGPVYIDSKKAGIGSISFSCLGKPISFPIDVLAPQIVKLSIVKQPAKLDYLEGEELNLAGLILEAVYNDGSIRTIKGLQSHGLAVEMGHADEGVTLSYEGEPFTIRVKVKKKEVPVTALSVELAHEPIKTKYVENDPQGFDLSGAELLVQMSDGRRLTVPVTYDMIDPIDLSQSGRQLLNIRYMGHTVVCSIFVSARTLTGLEVKSAMKKTEYIEGEKIDTHGLIMEACYDNGLRIPVDNYSVVPERVTTKDTEVQISYEDKILSVPITVHSLEIVLLDWARQPIKMSYYTQEKEFSCDGGVLRAKRNDGSEEDVPLRPEMVAGFRTDRIGPLLLTVTYENKTVPLSVMVKERTLLGLQVIKKPRTEYTEGEEFDPKGLVVEALYSGETSEVVGVNYLPYGPLKLDTASIMLVYKDKAVVMPITVSPPKTPEHLPIIAKPMSAEISPLDPHAENFANRTPDWAGGGVMPVSDTPGTDSANSSKEPEEGLLPHETETEDMEKMDSVEDTFSEEHGAGDSEEEGIRKPAGKRQWANVPAFYPSTIGMRFSDEAFS